ncbi:MAG: thioredoxin-dependent thiol peroxidase [Cyclobacteriaceae bacterium]|nr:thioredoxin-dependent thiol peroxidase [Cyclobacteriaceae bacterium]
MALSIGSKAPDFKTTDQDGNTVKLSDFKGRKVVLYFYPKDMTPGCTAEACSLRDNYKALQKAGYEVLGISADDEKSHRKFIEKEKLPFRLLADTDKTVHHLYGTWVEKSMYGRKYMGTARVTFVIDEKGIVQEIIEKVDTKNHAGQILGHAEPVAKFAKAPAKKVAAKAIKKKK